MTERAPIILLSGPPASGKSTVGKKLAKLAAGGSVYIEGDSFWFYMVKAPPGVARGPDPQKSQMIIKAMVAAATHYADAGYETIVDFSIGAWNLPPVLPLLKGYDTSYILLYPSKETCAARALTRKEGPADYQAVYSELHDAFAQVGPLGRCVVREELEPDDMAKRLRDGLDAGGFRLG